MSPVCNCEIEVTSHWMGNQSLPIFVLQRHVKNVRKPVAFAVDCVHQFALSTRCFYPYALCPSIEDNRLMMILYRTLSRFHGKLNSLIVWSFTILKSFVITSQVGQHCPLTSIVISDITNFPYPSYF
jgi:hypothetical protein